MSERASAQRQAAIRALRRVRGAARPPAALLRRMRGAARQRVNPASRYFAAMSKKARRPLLRAPAKDRLRQPRGGGRLLRPAADRGRARGRGRAQRQRQRRKRGAAESPAQQPARRRGQHRRGYDRRRGQLRQRQKSQERAAKAEQGRRQSAGQNQQRDRPRSRTGYKPPAKRSKKTPNWSKKTPNRRAKTT